MMSAFLTSLAALAGCAPEIWLPLDDEGGAILVAEAVDTGWEVTLLVVGDWERGYEQEDDSWRQELIIEKTGTFSWTRFRGLEMDQFHRGFWYWEDNLLEFEDTGCDTVGVYEAFFWSENMELQPVDDPCQNRSNNVGADWRPVES